MRKGETPHTTTDDNIFNSSFLTHMMNQGEFIFCHQVFHTAATPKLKRKLSLGMSFPKKGDCRSMSARLVDNSSLSRNTYQARRQQTETSRLKTLFKYIVHCFSSIEYEWYAVVTYQPFAHTCNSGKLYVVITYRSIICNSYESTYPICAIPLNWSKLGGSNYGTNG